MRFSFQDAILYDDDHFLVVNKPPSLATLEDRNAPINLQVVAKQYDENLRACHRLDKDTSGAILFAKSDEAYRHASIQFEGRNIGKTYHAVVNGTHQFEDETVDAPILPSSKGGVKIDHRKGKPSITHFNTLEVFKKHSLIECKPVTGRMHQIRIHLATINAPIVNDTLYDGAPLYLSNLKRNYNHKSGREEQPLIKRFALHAQKLSFDNFSEQITIEADYPKDIVVLLKQLRKNH